MAHPRDCTPGSRFGRWTVVGFSHRDERSNAFVLCVCDCGTQRPVAASKLGRRRNSSCGCHRRDFQRMRGLSRWRDISERFVPEPNSGCWLWTGRVNASGYGIFNGPDYGKTTSAHRTFWIRHRGEIPAGLWVLHRCDTPPCVNPAHLFLGTPLENTQDMLKKGRASWQRKSA